MNRTFLKQHIGTVQLFSLAAFFALPLVPGVYFPFFSQDKLDAILAFEVGVLIYGFYLAGFLYLPIAVVDSVWVRRSCLLLACLMAIPFTSRYRQEYGFYGLLSFCALLFANFSPVFIAGIKFEERTKLTVEAALRSVVYVMTYALVAVSLDIQASVSGWRGNNALLFGSSYFGVLGFIESRRYYSKVINLIFHVVNGTFVRAPKSGIHYVKGKIRAHVLSKNNMHRGPMLFATGSAVSALSLVFLYATHTVESWFAIAAMWLFFVPLLILGVMLIFGGICHPFIAWRKGPSLLTLREQALKIDNKLYATGTIPRYSKREKRTGFSVRLIHYKVDSISGEEFVVRVKELFNEELTEKNLTYQTTDRETRFEVEYSPPPLSKTEMGSKGFHVWHLQASMNR